jgi:hypothetical protein
MSSINKVVRVDFPFPHLVIDNYLPSEQYEEFCKTLQKLKNDDFSQSGDASKLSKMGGYDCYYWLFPKDIPAPLNHFSQKKFIDFIALKFDLKLTPEITVQFNHHPKNSRNGTWHTDYVHCFHTEDDLNEDAARPWYFGCDYLSGTRLAHDCDKKILTRVRAASFLYFLEQDDWQPGDGGETGLGMRSPFNENIELHSGIEPHSNRLLIFECSPQSFHRMLSNTYKDRSLVIGWLHSTVKNAETRHGAVPEHWPMDAKMGLFNYNETI